MSVVYWQGRFQSEEEAVISVCDPSVQWGEGCFTTLLIREGVPLLLGWHLERMERQSRTLGLTFSWEEAWLHELVYRNRGERGSWKAKIALLAGSELFLRMEAAPSRSLKPLRLGIYPYPLSSPLHQLKSLAYLERWLLRRWAKQEGWDDVVAVEGAGWITEASSANLVWLCNGVLYTPDPSLPLLEGVGLRALCERVAPQMGWPVERCRATPGEIPSGAHLFLCNAVRGIMPVEQLGPHRFEVAGELAVCIARELEHSEQAGL